MTVLIIIFAHSVRHILYSYFTIKFYISEIHKELNLYNIRNMQNSETLKLIECPICFEVIYPPVFQCHNGHLVCSTCLPKITQCPTCRATMPNPPIRSLMVEKLTEHLITKSCPNSKFGCQIRMKPNEEANHIAHCDYISKDFCRLLGLECLEFVKKRDLGSHMKDYHMLTVLETNAVIINQELENETDIKPRKWLPITFSTFDEYFFVGCELTTEESGHAKISWKCTLAGSSNLSKTFVAVFSLFNRKKEITMSWQSGVLSSEDICGLQYFSLPVIVLRDFADGLKPLRWKIKVLIKKWSHKMHEEFSDLKDISMISISTEPIVNISSRAVRNTELSGNNISTISSGEVRNKELPVKNISSRVIRNTKPVNNVSSPAVKNLKNDVIETSKKENQPKEDPTHLVIVNRCVAAVLENRTPAAVSAFNLIDRSKQDDMYMLIIKRAYESDNGKLDYVLDFIHKSNGKISLGLKTLINVLSAKGHIYSHSGIFNMASLAKQTESSTVKALLPETTQTLFWRQPLWIELSCCKMRLDSNQFGDVYLHKQNDGDYQKWTITSAGNYFVLKNKCTSRLLKCTGLGLFQTIKSDAGTPDENFRWKMILTKDKGTETIQFQNVGAKCYLTNPRVHGESVGCKSHFSKVGENMTRNWLIKAA